MQISVALLHIMPDNTGIYIKNIIVRRSSLAMVYLLVDCSITPQRMDLQYASWLFKNKVPFSVVFTKVGKLGLLVSVNNRSNE